MSKETAINVNYFEAGNLKLNTLIEKLNKGFVYFSCRMPFNGFELTTELVVLIGNNNCKIYFRNMQSTDDILINTINIEKFFAEINKNAEQIIDFAKDVNKWYCIKNEF